MRKVIVSTTINEPTEAIRKFDAMPDWELVVVGDLKTPSDYKLERGLYLTPGAQAAWQPALSIAIGWNCIQRRNIGFLYAIKEMKADIIATVDDDNVPYDEWGKDLMLNENGNKIIRVWETEQAAFDPIWATYRRDIWHRGFPLQLLDSRNGSPDGKHVGSVDIQADFWDGDPDVDAFCRMEHGPFNISFITANFPFMANKISPFNSQNTFLLAKVMPHYFMYPGVGRMDDIWSSYHVQQQGFKVVYGQASVRQVRNPHDLTKDMKAEYLGYEHNLEIVQSGSVEKFLPEQAKRAFKLYQEAYE